MNLLFPRWIEWSGLPRALNERCKSPLAWLLFRKVVELDTSSSGVPGTVEITPAELGELVGLSGAEVLKVLAKLRKKGAVMRSFLPDTEDEVALFQVRVPLETPVPAAQVLDAHPELGASVQSLRYATIDEAVTAGPIVESRLKQVVDLYLDGISMKMNSFILDELRLISQRYDMDLVRKIFARARKKERQNLGWILTEIRREKKQSGGSG